MNTQKFVWSLVGIFVILTPIAYAIDSNTTLGAGAGLIQVIGMIILSLAIALE